MEEWGVGDPVLLVHGSFDPGVEQWIGQQPLSDRFRLLVIDRRGFGGSPAAEREDFEWDADDLEQILEERGGAHLVGLSYGALSSLIVSAKRGSLVRSLCVIEPPLYSILRGHPGVESMIKHWTGVLAADWDESPAEGWVDFMRALGLSWSDFAANSWEEVKQSLTDAELVNARPSLRMRPPWDAVVPLDALRDQPFPKLIVSGDWQNVGAQARDLAGAAFKAICDELAERIGAERVTVPDAAHTPQIEQPEAFNRVLDAFLQSA